MSPGDLRFAGGQHLQRPGRRLRPAPADRAPSRRDAIDGAAACRFVRARETGRAFSCANREVTSPGREDDHGQVGPLREARQERRSLHRMSMSSRRSRGRLGLGRNSLPPAKSGLVAKLAKHEARRAGFAVIVDDMTRRHDQSVLIRAMSYSTQKCGRCRRRRHGTTPERTSVHTQWVRDSIGLGSSRAGCFQGSRLRSPRGGGHNDPGILGEPPA